MRNRNVQDKIIEELRVLGRFPSQTSVKPLEDSRQDFIGYLSGKLLLSKSAIERGLNSISDEIVWNNDESCFFLRAEPKAEIKEEIKQYNLGMTAKGLEVYDGETFMNLNIPKPDFQVEGLMIEKGMTILGGYQSTFKTHTAAHLALSIINGADFLGKFPCKKGAVLYVNEELHAGGFQELLKKAAKGSGLNITKDLVVMNFQNLKIDRPEDNKKYVEIIEKHKITLVIFDAFRECFTASENSGDDITKVMTEFVRPIIEKTGCSFLIIMHKGKAGAASDARQAVDLLRGSSVFRNYPDSIILMDRVRMTERVIMTHEKIRGTKEQEPVSIIWKFDSDSIRPEVMSQEELDKIMIDDCKRDMVEFVKDLDELETGKESKIYKKLIGSQKYSNGTFYDALKELKEEGKITKKKNGLYEVIDRRLDDF